MATAPGPRGFRLIASLRDVRRDRIGFVKRVQREYGDLAAFRTGPRTLFIAGHPDHARHVLRHNASNYRKGIGLIEAAPLLGNGLLTSDGEDWVAQRRALEPLFARPDPAIVTERVDAALDRFERDARRDGAIEITAPLDALCLRVAARHLLGVELGAEAIAVCDDLRIAVRWAMRRATALVAVPLRLPTPSNVRCRRALERLERFAGEVTGHLHRDGRGDPAPALARDQILTLLLAGFDTTASAITWALVEISRRPDVQRRLADESDDDCLPARAGRELSYTAMVLAETLRLHPPVWVLPRRARRADELGGCRVPAGSDVLVSILSIHRHPDYWKEPDRFDPDRFAAGAAAEGVRRAYLPFGAGARACPGQTLAQAEAALTLSRIAKRFRLLPAAEPVAEEGLLTLRPRGPVRLRALARTAAPAGAGRCSA